MPDPASYVTPAIPTLKAADLSPPPAELDPEIAKMLLQRVIANLPALAPPTTGVSQSVPASAPALGSIAVPQPATNPVQGFFQRLKSIPSHIPIVRGAEAGAKKVLSTAGEIGSNIANKPLKVLNIPGFSNVKQIGESYKLGRQEVTKGLNTIGGATLDAATYFPRKIGIYDEGKTKRPPTTATNQFRLIP